MDAPPTDGAVILGDGAEAVRQRAAQRAGVLCFACAEPIDEPGWQYFLITTEVRDGRVGAQSGMVYLCNRPSCAEARAAFEQEAAARRPWPPWFMLGDGPPETQAEGES